jgi:hypothetical protein
VDIELSDHAEIRAAQRNLSYDEICFILIHGSRQRRSGVIFYCLHRKHLPDELPGNHPYRRLVGTTVIVSRDGSVVVTAYRNEEAYRQDRRKAKYERRIRRRAVAIA